MNVLNWKVLGFFWSSAGGGSGLLGREGGLKGCFKPNAMFSGYVIFFCIAFLPLEKKRSLFIYRLVTSLPLITLLNSVDLVKSCLCN